MRVIASREPLDHPRHPILTRDELECHHPELHVRSVVDFRQQRNGFGLCRGRSSHREIHIVRSRRISVHSKGTPYLVITYSPRMSASGSGPSVNSTSMASFFFR